jgi:hypothetical protein
MIGDFVCSASSRILGPSVELHARGSRGGIFSDFVSLGCGASPVAASAAPAAARPAACPWAAPLLRRRPLLRPLQREGMGVAFRSRGPSGSGDAGSVDESESSEENLTVYDGLRSKFHQN